MKEVKCPKCNSIFEMDASGYADIVKQVRSEEFNNELKNRIKELKSNHDIELELAQQTITTQKDKEISSLQNQIANHSKEIELVKTNALSEVRDELFAKEKQIQRLQNEREAAKNNAELLVTKAKGELEKEILDLKGKLGLAEKQKELEIQQIEKTNLVKLTAKDELIRLKDEEIVRVRDMKLKMSVKEIGEKLEQWC